MNPAYAQGVRIGHRPIQCQTHMASDVNIST